MTEAEKRLKRNAYHREYYRKHREEILAKQRAYYSTQSGKAAILKANKRYREAHPELIREKRRKANKRYREAHPELIREQQRKASKKYYQKVKSDPVLLERRREWQRQYHHSRIDHIRAYQRKWYAEHKKRKEVEKSEQHSQVPGLY